MTVKNIMYKITRKKMYSLKFTHAYLMHEFEALNITTFSAFKMKKHFLE